MKYELLKEIGRGGMSVVYLAMDRHLNKQWAVKKVDIKGTSREDEAALRNVWAEAELLKKLDHPAFPRIVDIFSERGSLYIVMDYIEGETLERIIREEGARPEEQVFDWAIQLCRAIGYLHSLSPPVVYRDLKPSNIMLRPEGQIKIIDFGIAREYQGSRDTIIMGTAGYAPPEQLTGQTEPRSDIFALGMTMRALALGCGPDGSAEAENSLSESLSAIIGRCICPDPAGRYESAEELLYDLEHPELITAEHRRSVRRRLIRFYALLAAGLALLAASLILPLRYAYLNERDYDRLISVSESLQMEERLDAYERAVNIYPERPEGYIKMLEAFEDNGRFGEAESAAFLALYSANKELITDKAELCRRAGLLYFNFYSDGDTAVRIQKSYPFFREDETDIFYLICSFYKEYILDSLSMEEASLEAYEGLILSIEDALNRAGGANAYERISLYNAVFLLLHDQWENMRAAGVELDEIQSLMDRVYGLALDVKVSKLKSKELREEIIENYELYREEMI